MLDFLQEMPYDSDNYIVLDFETTNKSKGSALDESNRLVLSVWNTHMAGMGTKGTEEVGGSRPFGQRDNYTTRILWGTEYDVGPLIEALERADFIVCHNAKFELQWLARAGLDLGKVKVYDTLIGEYVLNGGLSVGLGLGVVASSYNLGGKEAYVDKCIKGGVCPSELPKSMLQRRCIYDVNTTLAIFLKQRERLRDSGQLPVLWTRCILTPVLADIERNGVALDEDRVNAEYESVLTRFNDKYRELGEITGGINLNSPLQRGTYIYEDLGIAEPIKRGKIQKTPAGGYKTDSATILSLKGKSESQRSFLTLYAEYANLNAKLTKSLNTYKKCVDNGDLLLAQFNQTRTRTQRLSSSGSKYSIQFQNQPREYKKLFTARFTDWLVAEIDGAQLEFRVAAFLGQDKRAVNDIREGFDVHSYSAQTMTDAGQDTSRQEAKAHTFKPLFGGASGTDAEQTYYTAFKEKYPGITSAQQSWIDEALATQELRTVTGLVFYYPGTRVQRGSSYVVNSTQICNYPVQSFATADIIPIALTYLWHELRNRGMQSFIVNTVHDSAIMEVHPDELEEVRQISVDCFTHSVYNYLKAVYNIEFNVPLGTGFKAGSHWSEGEETTESIDPPFEWVS
jgi:DNA polymerase I-like protein with 3'-5' exonuclease and polymerase domains